MRVIEVLSPGLLTTVQDLGRPGCGALGVSASGAADAVSLRLGNRLVGNRESAAALEMTLLGGTFRFPLGGVVALAGSDFGAVLEGTAVANWSPFEVQPGSTLRLGPTRNGARCYLCVRGGIAVPAFLGSASTHLLGGVGGHQGRALQKGDVLQMGSAEGGLRPVLLKGVEKFAPRKVLRVTAGPQYAWFTETARRAFCRNMYVVAEESNRMGLRLNGSALPDANHGEMISEGVALGAVQIAAGGKPIILFVEQQTTGGYAKIANVISADLHCVGQLRPRDEVRFAWVSFDEARRALAQQEKLIRKLAFGVPAKTQRRQRKSRGAGSEKRPRSGRGRGQR